MPTDLDAVRELLPWWVQVGSWLAMPLLVCLGALLVAVICHLRLPKIDGLHWTEKARLLAADSATSGLVPLAHVALATVLMHLVASGLLIGSSSGLRVALTICASWLLVMLVQCRRLKRILPSVTALDYVYGVLFFWLVFYPFVVIAALVAIFGPAGFVGHELSFVLVFGGGLLLMLSVIGGHHMVLASWLGLVRPADERVIAIVSEAARLSNHVPRRSWIGRTPMANALALPSSNEIVITSRALRCMTDEQLVALMLHEIGHLKESFKAQTTRLLGLSPVIVLAMWRPLIAWCTVYGWLALLVASLAVVTKVVGATRKMESDADEHAHDHSGDDGGELYARSLERLHELNLIPAAWAGQNQTHPNLYDRMLAAGVTPDYERPEAPVRSLPKLVRLAILPGILIAGQWIVLEEVHLNRPDGVDAAMLDLALTGGSVGAVGELGCAWEQSQPEKAEVMLRAATARSQWPEYPLRLARLLSIRDPDAANGLLQRAEKQLGRWQFAPGDEMDPWFVDTVDDVRDRLGLPKKVW